MRKKGFTLIELLVVIAIIALLLSILMPSLRKAKDVARDVICRTNLKTMQMASILYADDNGNRFMEYDHKLWIHKIGSYVDNMDEVRYCPSTKIVDQSASLNTGELGSATRAWMRRKELNEDEYGSYGINSFFYRYDTRPGLSDAFKKQLFSNLNEVRVPGLTPVFSDSSWVDGSPRDTDVCPDDFDLACDFKYGSGVAGMQRLLMNRHGKHINIGFIDGHQEAVDLEMLWTLKWNKNFKNMGVMTRVSGGPIYQ